MNLSYTLMKHPVTLFFFLLAIFGVNRLLGQNLSTHNDSTFLNNIIQKNWSAAEKTLYPELKKQLPNSSLKILFDGVTPQLGALEKFDTTASASKFIKLYICRFSKETNVMQIAHNDSAQIVGFYFRPLTQLYKLPPYNISSKYKQLQINIASKQIHLPGVLTIPILSDSTKKFPVIVFVGGSGPSDKDESIGVNKPFKDLAIGLSLNGIGSLRFDKRSYAQEDSFKDKSYTLNEEYFEDVQSAIQLAQKTTGVDVNRIYIMGHSLGGMITPKLLTLNPVVKGGILLEANVRPVNELMYEQILYLNKLSNNKRFSKKEITRIKENLEKIKHVTAADSSKDFLNIKGSYWLSMNRYDPIKVAKTLKNQKILIIHGGKDYQVTLKEFILWKNGLKNCKNASFKQFDNLNHALIESDNSRSPDEYNKPGNVPIYLVNYIRDWIVGKAASINQ